MLPYIYCPLFHKHTFLLYHPREERERKEEEKEEEIYHNISLNLLVLVQGVYLHKPYRNMPLMISVEFEMMQLLVYTKNKPKYLENR